MDAHPIIVVILGLSCPAHSVYTNQVIPMWRGHHLSLSILVSSVLILCSCCCVSEPKYIENTPATPCTKWATPCRRAIEAMCPYDVQSEILSIEKLIDIALSQNPDTRVTWASARAAAYQLQAVKSTLYPAVDAEVAYAATYQNFTGKSGGGVVISPDLAEGMDDDLLDAVAVSFGELVGDGKGASQLIVSDISANYLLWDFGGRCAKIEAARQALQMANWTHNRTIQNVMIDVLVSYYAYLEAKAQLEAQRDDLEDAEVNVDAAKELFDAGVKTHLDVLQTSSQLVNIQLMIEKTRGRVKIELGNLANAMGLAAGTPLKVKELPENMPMNDSVDNVENLMEIAKKCRPDLSAYLSNYQKKQADLAVAKSDGNPFLVANADFERVSGLDGSTSSGHVIGGSIALEIPLFRGGYYSNNRRRAKANVSASFAELQSKESDVLLEVWKSYYAFKTAVKTYKSSEEFLKYTEETYEAALGGYKEGTGTILDVLSAQKALSQARAQIIQARTLWVTSLAGIAYATGTL